MLDHAVVRFSADHLERFPFKDAVTIVHQADDRIRWYADISGIGVSDDYPSPQEAVEELLKFWGYTDIQAVAL